MAYGAKRYSEFGDRECGIRGEGELAVWDCTGLQLPGREKTPGPQGSRWEQLPGDSGVGFFTHHF